jgi:hypothetical protein
VEFCVPYLLPGLQNKHVDRTDVDGTLMIFTYPELGKLNPQSQIYKLCLHDPGI